MFAVYADSFSSDAPLDGLVVGERPDPDVPDGWTTVTVKAASLNHHDIWSLKGVGLKEDALPMILGCDAAGLDEDGNPVVVHAVISDPVVAGRRDLRPQAVAAERALPGHLRRQGRRTEGQRRAQARVALLRGGGLPADRVAHGLPDALHPGRSQGRRQRARPGRRRRRRDGADHAGPRGRPEGVRHQPRRRQAQARAGDRRARGLRVRRAAARRRSTRSWRPSAARPGRTRSGRCVRVAPSSSPVRRPAPSSTTPSSPGSSSSS